MRKDIKLKKRHKYSGKVCEFYFVSRVVEPLSISPTIFTNRGLYGDLLYFCNVRWLSRGEMLRRVYILREKITIFLEKHECYRISQSRMALEFSIFSRFNIAFEQPEFAASGKAPIDTRDVELCTRV